MKIELRQQGFNDVKYVQEPNCKNCNLLADQPKMLKFKLRPMMKITMTMPMMKMMMMMMMMMMVVMMVVVVVVVIMLMMMMMLLLLMMMMMMMIMTTMMMIMPVFHPQTLYQTLATFNQTEKGRNLLASYFAKIRINSM